MNASAIKVRLALLNFLEFAVWGSYLISLGQYLASIGMGQDIFWFYAVQGIVSLFMPAVVGIVADRWLQAQRMLSLCHFLAGAFMLCCGGYCLLTDVPQFAPLFTFYTLSVAFYMPTIGLANSVAFNALTRAGLDTVVHFPPIRVFGTIGFICAMLFVNFTQFQMDYNQFFTSGVIGMVLAMYALTMPQCPVNKGESRSLADMLGLRAFKLFKQRRMAIFFIFSMLLGVSLQITNSYGTSFINSFGSIPEFAGDWGVRNATAIISISQISETLCILLIPFCLKRFGIKGVMLMSMFAWVLRFGFFGLGDTGHGVWLLVLSCIVYGVAFDFFNVSGGLFVDKETDPSIRSSAQGLFMIMTNGIGATVGTFVAGKYVVNRLALADGLTPLEQLAGWRESWYIFAAYALVVAILFIFIFRQPKESISSDDVRRAEEGNSGADGFIANS